MGSEIWVSGKALSKQKWALNDAEKLVADGRRVWGRGQGREGGWAQGAVSTKEPRRAREPGSQ